VPTNNSSFFEESTEQSQVKASIVSKYFVAWAKVIISTAKPRNGKIGYVDLFAGKGRYDDGTKSTPLLILEEAIKNPDLRNMIITVFSDSDPANVQSLDNSINTLPNINSLKYKPQLFTEIVNENITKIFSSIQMIPCLTFLDPWGYKGLSTRLINSVIKDWGCDCIIFFNYNRINMGLNNNLVKSHMDALFGENRADMLRNKLSDSISPSDRERIILKTLSDSMKELGGDYVLPFRFRSDRGERISHHLVFVTKHVKGYNIMKEIMANASSSQYQGVASFEYSPSQSLQPYLLAPLSPLNDLIHEIVNTFAGKSLTMIELFDNHNIGTNYTKKNYKQALMQLETECKISANPPSNKRPKETFGDKVKITFPPKRKNN
jgi:three-Cys-motif partner protein